MRRLIILVFLFAIPFKPAVGLEIYTEQVGPMTKKIMTGYQNVNWKYPQVFADVKRILITKDITNAFGVEYFLSKRISRKRIAELSLLVRSALPRSYKNVFVGFRLQDIQNGMYWAHAHQTPEMKINIIGYSLNKYNAEKRKKAKQFLKKNEKLIASGILGSSVGGRSIIYQKNGKYFYRHLYIDGSQMSDTELIRKNGRYWLKENSHKENLGISIVEKRFNYYDREGLILSTELLEYGK